MKVTLDIDDTDIIAQSLREHYLIQIEDISMLENKDKLSTADVEDLKYTKKINDAIRIVLSYYMTADEYSRFMESTSSNDEDEVGYPRS